ISKLNDISWNRNNSNERTHSVAKKKENELGVFDLMGNVYEWCHDWYGYDYYSLKKKVDPKGPKSGKYRVTRGGGVEQ
ncbi:hypothetical protein BVX99_00210, partial [bacterium F16]